MKALTKQRGVGIVAAIFLIVVVALIAAYMVRVGTVQQATSTMGLLGARAHFAAQSALDWAAAEVVTSGACVTSGTNFNLSGGALNGFQAVIDCNAIPVTEGADSYHVFALNVRASMGAQGSPDYVSRTISAAISSL